MDGINGFNTVEGTCLMFALVLVREVFPCFSDLTICSVLIHKNASHKCINCIGKVINEK